MKSFLVLAAAALVAASIAACSSDDDTTSGSGTTTGTGTGTTATAAAIADGESVVVAQGCAASDCHGSNLAGNIKQSSGNFSANITPDMATGIGSWTETDLSNALLDSVDDQGEALCAPMPKFPQLTTTQISDVYAYLQSIPAVSNAQTDTDCSGNPTSN